TGVHQLVGLLDQGFFHGRVAVAQRVDRPALDKVQISPAGMVLQPGTLTSHEHEVRAGSDLHEGVDVELAEFHGGSYGMEENKKRKKKEFSTVSSCRAQDALARRRRRAAAAHR